MLKKVLKIKNNRSFPKLKLCSLTGKGVILLCLLLMLCIIPTAFAASLDSNGDMISNESNSIALQSDIGDMQYASEDLEIGNENTNILEAENENTNLLESEGNTAVSASSKFIDNKITTNKSSTIYSSVNRALGEADTPVTIYIGSGSYIHSKSGDLQVWGNDYNTRVSIVNKTVTLIGSGMDKTFFNGEKDYFFKIKGSNVTFINMDFSNGLYPFNFTYSNITIINCSFHDNDGFRGGVFNTEKSNLTFISSMFYQNGAGKGGVFHTVNDTLTIKDCNFSSNYADCGGAIRLAETNMTIDNTLFYNNSAILTGEWGHGGAIQQLYSSIARITNSRFISNYAGCNGGGIGIDSGSLTVEMCEFINNTGIGSAIGEYYARGTNLSVFINLTNSAIITNDTSNFIVTNELNNPNSVYIENNWWGTNRIPYVDTDIEKIVVADASIGEDNKIHINLNKLNTGEMLIGTLPQRTVILTPEENFTSPALSIIREVTANYNGNLKEDEINITIDNQLLTLNHEIPMEDVEFTLDDFTPYVGHEIYITANILHNNLPITQGFVEFYIGNELVSIEKIKNGNAFLYFKPSKELNSTLTAIYMGDELYNNQTIVRELNITRYVVNISHVISNESYNIQRTINYLATDGDLIYLGDNMNYTNLTEINVKKSVVIMGGENLNISCIGDCLFYIIPKSNGGPAYVEFRNINCTFLNNNTSFVKAVVENASNYSNIASISIHDNYLNAEDANGISILEIEFDLEEFIPTGDISIASNIASDGIKTANILSGDYDSIFISGIKEIATVLTFDNTDPSKPITFILKDIHGNALANENISYSINGANYTITTDSVGMGCISGLNEDSVIEVRYLGRDCYLPSNENLTVIFRKDTKINLNGMTINTVTFSSQKGEYITISLTDSNGRGLSGKNLIVTLNNRIYNLTTNSNGAASLELRIAYAGTYMVTAAFLSDDGYYPSINSAKITVKTSKTSLTLKNYKFKAKKKTKKIKIALKSNGKALKNKKITVKVNGKKYTAKTNSKGIATIKVKLSKKKIYKYAASFAGDSQYAKVSKKSKIKIY